MSPKKGRITGGVMMKRIVSVVLAVIMVLAMSSSVFAASKVNSNNAAQNIALKNAKLSKSQVQQIRVKYDREDGEYDVKFVRKSNGSKFDFEIRKSNGRIIEKSIDYKYKRNSSRKKVGKVAAQKAAAKAAAVKLSVVQRGKCRYEYDDGEGIYEVEFRNGNYKYDIEILAPTGKVIDYNWEYRGR